MAKQRKTKKEKVRSHRRVQQAQQSEISPLTFEFVKGEFDQTRKQEINQAHVLKQHADSHQIEFLASTKRDLFKTFILASLLFAAEAVLYFAWK